MDNQNAAIMRKLSDPDFQAGLVNKCIALVMGLAVSLVVFVVHDAYVWVNLPRRSISSSMGKILPRR